MKIYPLQAAHGDALIVESEHEGRLYRIVIDGGPEETAEIIAKYYRELDHLDLLVLTHYDNDHITGIIKYLECLKGKDCVIDRVWANCATIVDYDDDENTAAYDDAYVLANLLEKQKRKGLIGEWNDNLTTETAPLPIGPFLIDVVSPTPAIQSELLKKYRDYIEKHGLEDDPDDDEEVSFGRTQCDATKDFPSLVKSFRPCNTSFMNKSSIALRFQAEGKSLLLLGDADAKVVADALVNLDATVEKPLHFDLIKVSHHGSKANINKKLFEITDCSNYLFTTNGGTGGAYHPDRQTIACIDAWARKNNNPITLFFNYPLNEIMKRNVGLLKDSEKDRFIIVEGQSAITL